MFSNIFSVLEDALNSIKENTVSSVANGGSQPNKMIRKTVPQLGLNPEKDPINKPLNKQIV